MTLIPQLHSSGALLHTVYMQAAAIALSAISISIVLSFSTYAEDRVGDAWSDSRNPVFQRFNGERLDLWSLKPIARPTVPEGCSNAMNGIDAFYPAAIPSASAEVLARRVALTLTGLPPSPEELEQYLADTSPNRYERLVDRLLASPGYGVHAARAWLDLVRYSDSNGFDWDEFRPEAWRFRDYVVRSFNADKPFDIFVREQLAGDELLHGSPRTLEEQDALIATGYLRIGPQDNSSSLFNEQARSRAELMADLVETTSSAFLGLTMACCRCHDHKTDPLTQEDHYRLRAFFEGVTYADRLPIDLEDVQEAIQQHNAPIEAELGHIEKTIHDQDTLKEKRAELLNQRRAFSFGLLMTDAEGTPSATKVLFQGDYRQPRDEVAAGFPSALDPNPAVIQAPPNPKTTGRRFTLARWIVSPENPLTARVLANRLWQQHFGKGLVETPNDFGISGKSPSHPALLDWLATQVRDEGEWSIKRLHHQILTSAAYRQQGPPRRLTAEQLRDALLLTSGELRFHSGGPPVWPELPPEVASANPAFLDDNAEKTKGWYPSPSLALQVRSLYLIQKRTVRVPFMETFDLPENMASCARRESSTVAPQALALLNGPFAAKVATDFARRIQDHSSTPLTQVTEAFRLAYLRSPTDEETTACLNFLKNRELTELCRVLFNANEFVYFD